MKEESDIMDELHGLDGEMKSFPPDAHWFCPKENDADVADYDNPEDDEETISVDTKLERIQDAKRRHEVAYKYSIILGLDVEIVGDMVMKYTDRLNSLLSTCDKCIRNWHAGRKAHLKELSEQYDDDTVAALSNRLNTIDFKRIDYGLQLGKGLFEGVKPELRNQTLLTEEYGFTPILALFEALCCVDYHNDDEKLAERFDYVFEEAQSRRVLRMSDALPAMSRFLFSDNQLRLRFGFVAWQKMGRKLTPEIFEWAVHDSLSHIMASVSNPSAQIDEIGRFWQGFLLILDKMDERLITHSLRAMEVQPDIYRLALQHLSCGSATIVTLVIRALHILVSKAPKDFWSAMGTISHATVAEQIFISPGFEKLMMDPNTFKKPSPPPTPDPKKGKEQKPPPPPPPSPITGWEVDFLRSIEPVHQYDACRKLLEFLFAKLQHHRYPQTGRESCCRAGLQSLHATLSAFNSTAFRINHSTSLIVISNIMGLVNQYKSIIIACANTPNVNGKVPALKALGMEVIKEALSLDVKSIASEFFAFENGSIVQRGSRTHSESIWEEVLDIFRPGNLPLVKCIIPATWRLVGLDELLPEDKRHPERLPKDKADFNKDLQQLMDNVARVYERLSDFPAEELKQLIQDYVPAEESDDSEVELTFRKAHIDKDHVRKSLFGCLLSSDKGISEATVEVVKVMTGQTSRQDAIQDLLELSLAPMLRCLTSAISSIVSSKTFGSIPTLIKICRQILKALCGNTGVLRTRASMEPEDREALSGWWMIQWKALNFIFKNTERWSPRVKQSTAAMQDFCRDCMEYAEELFNEYSVFASALQEPISPDDDTGKSISRKASPEKVLSVICENVEGLVGFVRLRDTYLISVITSLLGKLLRCLGEYSLTIDEISSNFLKDACKRESSRGFRRTNLTNQQKAELQRALDENEGVDFVEIPKPVVKKQATIDAWSKSADGVKHEPKLPASARPALGAASNLEKHKATLDQMRAREAANKAANDQSRQSFLQGRKKAEEERKRRDAEIVAKAKALREPTVRGEGSGLSGIGGVAGKDHAPQRNEIMVGSSDEESSDEDVDETNALVKTGKVKSQAAREIEEMRRRAFKEQQNGPVRKTKIVRSAKDLRARVEPNMDKLYLEILNWDIFHDGDTPPSNNECRRIDNKYQDLDLYKKTFGPLLISEVWRSLITAKDENNFKPVEIKVENRLSVDKFMEVNTTMPMSAQKELKMSERDIVLLSRSPDPLNDKEEPHCLARIDRTTRKKDVIEITYRVSRDINPKFLQSLVPNGKIHALKIADMTTTQREFAALSSLEYYDLCTEVLEAKPSPLQKYGDEKVSSICAKYNLNRGQATAILSAADNDGFTLIQGPPGSGKTKTIVAMVGALLTKILQQQKDEQAKVRPPVQGQAPKEPPPPKKKLLICAPSNAAVDELVLRLKQGIQPLNGPTQRINVIRIGRSDAINAEVKDVMLDELVRKKLEGDDGEKNKLIQDRDKLHKQAAEIKERLNVIRPLMDEALKNNDQTEERNLRREFDHLKRNQAHIGAKIDEDKESGNTVSRQNEINRRRFQQEIINGAHVLCSTLSGSGHDMFRNLDVEFETVIIDEAAQCIELSALIPLKYGCSKCILVGDPEQLPPTVLSRSAQSYGYEQSLFVRMQKNHPKDIHLLDTQYRMHPEISRFPSQQFYNSRLIDGDGMARLRVQPWHASSILGPYRFFDVKGVQTKQAQGHSFINVPELNAAMGLYKRLKSDYKDIDFRGKIGIITSYKAQLNEMKTRFSRQYGDGIFEEIEFNTTDAFQGREREIIIFSCVRAKATGGIGFLGDIRRMNVGLTRAKSSLWVLGDSRSLQQGEFWNRLIQDAQSRDRYTTGDITALFNRPTSKDAKPEREYPPQNPVGANGSSGQAGSSGSSAPSSSKSAVQPKIENDVEMMDAPLPIRKQSIVPPGGKNRLWPEPHRPVKKEARDSPQDMSSPASEVNSHGKRTRDASDNDDDAQAKKPKATNDLEAALQARQAEKEARQAAQAARPPRPPGMIRPRKPVDPFIQKKKRPQ